MDFDMMIKGVQHIRETHKPCAYTEEGSIALYELRGQGTQDISNAVIKIRDVLANNHISLASIDFVFDATRFIIQRTTSLDQRLDINQQDAEQNK
jgi:hypothetical protein